MWTAVLLVGGLAFAQVEDSGSEASVDEEGEPAPTAEIVVYGDLVVARRRGELTQSLRELGYDKGKRKDGRTIYRNQIAWRPDVVVDDDGYYTVKRSPVRLDWPDLPGVWGRPPVGVLPCLVSPTLCIKAGGQVVSPRKLNAAKRQVHEGIADEAERWQQAVSARAMRHRLEDEIPVLLDGIWQEGRGPGGEHYDTREARRAALLDFWATRTDYPEGQLAREMAAIFLEMEVQGSQWPVTKAEEQAANARCGCSPLLGLVDGVPGLDSNSTSP